MLASAQRLARQAADLEEEAKRSEAQAFYCVREAEQLDGAPACPALCISCIAPSLMHCAFPALCMPPAFAA